MREEEAGVTGRKEEQRGKGRLGRWCKRNEMRKSDTHTEREKRAFSARVDQKPRSQEPARTAFPSS